MLDAKLETEKTLSQQMHRLELDLRQTGRRKENLEHSRADLEIKLTELRLDQESLDKSTLKARTMKENVLVQLNLLRLQVEKLTEQVATKSDELISLENRRQQLQLSMQERVIEIDAHIAALRTQLKTEEEARHLAAVELQDRKRRADTFQAKYEVQMGKFKIEGEEVSQTYHVIRFAQEREQVNARGEELEQQVQTAIRELRAVERELQKLNGLNSSFRASFTAIGEGDSDLERKRVLEEQLRVAEQRLNARRAEAHSVAEERLRMEQTREQQQNRVAQMQDEIGRMKGIIEKLMAENRELSDKLRRATHMLGKAKEAHRRGANVSMDVKYPATLLEMDVELRMTKSTIETAVNELTKLAESNRDIEPKLRLGLSQIGIGMKSLGPKLTGTKSPSIVTPQTSGRSSASGKSGGSSGSSASKSSAGSRGSAGPRKPKPSVQNVKLP
jgi:chromosome segregation ATPase